MWTPLKYQDSGLLNELDNEQVYEVARVAAQTIESVGTAKVIIRAWCEEHGVTSATLKDMRHSAVFNRMDTSANVLSQWHEAIREMQS